MNRLRRWWDVGERACARLTQPRVDVSAADRDIEALWRASWIGGHFGAFARRLRAAWLESRCRRVARAAGVC